MMKLADPSTALLAASGGDTVKLFDVSVESGDPCTLSYTPSPSFLVNSVKWNHTNLVVASAGEDKKISLWRRNGQSLGTIPLSRTDSGDGIEDSMLAISFSNKGSRYICSGGSGRVVRIWDLQRKLCIKRLMGHRSTITGTVYNCKDEHLASISTNGDLIVHNLAFGGKAAELKDPNNQVLRVLDYSQIGRHLLVTAGDDGSVHLWDTTSRHPKNSWLKQHSAPTAGVSFSPSTDKIIATVGLDKKLYTYDSGSRRSSSIISYEEPFSSLAFRDDGLVLAAGTSCGRVVFYDVRGKPQPYTVLRAYSSSEAVTSLCWQRSKPVVVNENCTAETALLGGSVKDSILMPDPLPSVAFSSISLPTSISSVRNAGRSGPSEVPFLSATGSGPTLPVISVGEETPLRRHGGPLVRLKAASPGYNFKDDMEVFSPLVEVQPITPSLDKLWDNLEGSKIDNLSGDKKPSYFVFPSSSRRYPFAEDGINEHPVFDWKPSSTSRQDDTRPSIGLPGGLPLSPSSRSTETSITPPECWGGERFDKIAHLHQAASNHPPRFGMSTSESYTSGSLLPGMQDVSSSTSMSSLTSLSNVRARDVSSDQETQIEFLEQPPSSPLSLPLGSGKGITGLANTEVSGLASSTLARRYSTYADRISTTPSFSIGTSLGVTSPKVKKTGSETREDLLNSLLSRSESRAAAESGVLPVANGGIAQPALHKVVQPETQQGSSFPLQIFQHTLEETLGSFRDSIREDMRNLHIEILRQFHMQESLYLENQAEMMKKIGLLQKENQVLRQSRR